MVGEEGALAEAPLRCEITMGVSTDTGRGWVSNNNGNPITAARTRTTEPIKR
jgi:hypothetical protein